MPDVGNKICIAMPQAYRDFLAAKPSAALLEAGFSTLLAILWSVSLFFSLRSAHPTASKSAALVSEFVVVGMHLLAVGVGVWFWQRQRRQPWQYTVDATGLTLIAERSGGRTWAWQTVRWAGDVIIKVECDEWRALPALRVTASLQHLKIRQVFWMVYENADQVRMQTEVLPLIEDYRKRHWHQLWSEEQTT